MACHARAPTAAATDWPQIAARHLDLARVAPSPIVERSRAVAVAMVEGAAAGLAIVDELASDWTLKGYHRLPAVRGDLLARLGRNDEAAVELQRAADLTRNARERDLLRARARASRTCVADSKKTGVSRTTGKPGQLLKI